MDRKVRFVKFSQTLLSISPKYFSTFGNSASWLGGSSSAPVMDGLRKALNEFAKAYTSSTPSQSSINESAKKVEGMLLAENTIGNLTDQQTDKLIDELHDLIEAKENN